MTTLCPSKPATLAERLEAVARHQPQVPAIIDLTRCRGPADARRVRTVTYGELVEETCRVSRCLAELGFVGGQRVALLMPPGVDLLIVLFSLFRLGVVPILVDPAIGLGRTLAALAHCDPAGFVGVPLAQWLRLLSRRFPHARQNVLTGPRYPGLGAPLSAFRARRSEADRLPAADATQTAAILYTSGSTGPPKPVVFRHEQLSALAAAAARAFEPEAGQRSLACFPLFAVFDCVWGATAILPCFDTRRPARCAAAQVAATIRRWEPSRVFASPALWTRLGQYCAPRGLSLPSLRRVLTGGAATAPTVLKQIRDRVCPAAEVHVVYGATEALLMTSRELRSQPAEEAADVGSLGRGACVGLPLPGLQVRVLEGRRSGRPTSDASCPLPPGEIGEVAVAGPWVSDEYFRSPATDAARKLAGGGLRWHRTGDLGYLDAAGRLWYCGRLEHRVIAGGTTYYSIPCEQVFDTDPEVRQSALVGVATAAGVRPLVVIERRRAWRLPWLARRRLAARLQQLAAAHAATRGISSFLFRRRLPVDVRHNAKILRHELAAWAARKLPAAPGAPLNSPGEISGEP